MFEAVVVAPRIVSGKCIPARLEMARRAFKTRPFSKGLRMSQLILSRKEGERIVIGEGVEIVVLEIHGSKVKLGIAADQEIRIRREEDRREAA